MNAPMLQQTLYFLNRPLPINKKSGDISGLFLFIVIKALQNILTVCL